MKRKIKPKIKETHLLSAFFCFKNLLFTNNFYFAFLKFFYFFSNTIDNGHKMCYSIRESYFHEYVYVRKTCTNLRRKR